MITMQFGTKVPKHQTPPDRKREAERERLGLNRRKKNARHRHRDIQIHTHEIEAVKMFNKEDPMISLIICSPFALLFLAGQVLIC